MLGAWCPALLTTRSHLASGNIRPSLGESICPVHDGLMMAPLGQWWGQESTLLRGSSALRPLCQGWGVGLLGRPESQAMGPMGV